MPNQHKTPLLGWHPSDPTLKAWVKAEAERQGVSIRELLDKAVGSYRDVVEDWRSALDVHNKLKAGTSKEGSA